MKHFLCLLVMSSLATAVVAEDYFRITVVDEDTGRGVPLVELRTVNNIRLYTDSAGVVAFREPGLMDTAVYFHVSSHGYEYPKDGLGYRGVRLKTTPGKSAEVRIRRINVAERLYRMTGAGIYRDSLLLGDQPPTDEPVLNARVLGSDSVVNAVYRGRIHWFWGDTNQPDYPLGNFDVPGATSPLPGDGGLDPDLGVNLHYFTGPDGFAKPTADMPGPGPTWIGGLVTVPDDDGRERLLASYVKIRQPMETYERGIIEFDDERQQFGSRQVIPLNAPLQPNGHPLKHTADGVEYVYFGHPFPCVRVRATARDLRDLSQYEAWTCLASGSRDATAEPERDANGNLQYAWKQDTVPVTGKLRQELMRKNKLKRDEGLIHPQDVETGKSVAAHSGSVYWNEYRQRWVAVFLEVFGSSMLGEIWYAEGDTPLGPWVYARKIVTHDKYSFYNPKQHPMFDQNDGRTIFFEGTYTHTFSGNSDQTPRYDYNQIMYRLDLSDPRFNLPVPVYVTAHSGSSASLPATAALVAPQDRGGQVGWFALERPSRHSLPVFSRRTREGAGTLVVGRPGEERDAAESPLFHALPADLPDPPPTTTPLFEFTSPDGHPPVYSTKQTPPVSGYRRTPDPLCLVWIDPTGETPVP